MNRRSLYTISDLTRDIVEYLPEQWRSLVTRYSFVIRHTTRVNAGAPDGRLSVFVRRSLPVSRFHAFTAIRVRRRDWERWYLVFDSGLYRNASIDNDSQKMTKGTTHNRILVLPCLIVPHSEGKDVAAAGEAAM